MIEGRDSAVYETPTTSMAEGRARVGKSRLVSMSGSMDQIGNHRHVKRSSDYKRIKRHIRSPAVIEYCQERRIIARQRNCICGEPMRVDYNEMNDVDGDSIGDAFRLLVCYTWKLVTKQ
ncbi:hypothetical protein SprV_ctg2202921300 [Sparganum proliferum]